MITPEYQGVEPNEKYRALEVQAARKINGIPEFRRNSPDEYFTEKTTREVAEIHARMKLVNFHGR
ncbi:MAG: hypothetical protein DRH90_17680 [Deltaproteobacteria bacterium]|nr:MAG: hypothetical protein DRH90_17680 [Deltaproteobacteria bacterium]RLC12887.1 MAG: hypothetical protein DRI24_16830 [Deltaproteobacteria bacterium]